MFGQNGSVIMFIDVPLFRGHAWVKTGQNPGAKYRVPTKLQAVSKIILINMINKSTCPVLYTWACKTAIVYANCQLLTTTYRVNHLSYAAL